MSINIVNHKHKEITVTTETTLSGSHEDVITGILVRYPRIRGTPPAVLAAPHAKPSTSQHRHGSSHRSHHHRHSNKREHHASSSSSSNGGSKLSPLPPAVTKIRDLPPPPTISAPSPVPPPPISNKPLPPPPISSKPLPVAPPLAPPPSVPLNVPVSSIPLPPDEEEIPSHQKMLLELNRQIEEEQSQLAKLRETAGDAAPYSPSMLDQEEISPIAVARDPIVEAYQRTTRKSAPADEDISLVDMDLDDQAPSSSATSSSAAVPAARTVAPSSTPSSSSTSSDVSVPSDPRRLRR
ncbi:unnamed protein product [Cyprideis torosa]|uniref:Uncharacterized protein n=1 Tax=Cyprideis torosa TaxID=163714 RepID=A0A7R8WBS1_9CRUS|nr:unnamed protein product [Cyprideis torosa]CAG0887297.1 unnamed protein product [Cyprideis torosa]